MIINKIQKFFFTHPLISLRHILYPVVYSARYPQRRKRAVSHRTEVLYVQQVVTVCPGSSDPFYIVSQLYKMGHYFLDTQYPFNIGFSFFVWYCVQFTRFAAILLNWGLGEQAAEAVAPRSCAV